MDSHAASATQPATSTTPAGADARGSDVFTTTTTTQNHDGTSVTVTRTRRTMTSKTQSHQHTRRTSSRSTLPKVVPPFYSHTPQRCSWEEAYNFTPKIHSYHGVQGVVHRAWMTSASTHKEPTETAANTGAANTDNSRQGTVHSSTNTRRHKRDARMTATATAQTSTASRSVSAASRGSCSHRSRDRSDSHAQTTRTRRTSTSPVANRRAPSAADATSLVECTRVRYAAPRRPAPRAKPVQTTHAAAAPRVPQQPSSAKLVTAAAGRVQQAEQPNTPPPPASRAKDVIRAHAPGPYVSKTASFVPVPPTEKADTAQSASPPHTSRSPRSVSSGYQPRTCAAYTLPPDYAMQAWCLEQYTSPNVVIEGSAQHRWGDPAKPNTIYISRHTRHNTRRALMHAYSAEARRRREDRYRRGLAHTTDLHGLLGTGGTCDEDCAQHNYNFAAGADLFEVNAEQRAAQFYAKEARMRANLIEGVAPLAKVLPAPQAATPRTITAVLDDGHACSPILLNTNDTRLLIRPPHGDASREGGAGGGEVLVSEDATAVLVRPCVAREVPATWRDLCAAEAARVLPKGREWDRQHAVRLAVGATTQEAIIDLLIDPRYRRPGEFVRHRTGGSGGSRRPYSSHPFAM